MCVWGKPLTTGRNSLEKGSVKNELRGNLGGVHHDVMGVVYNCLALSKRKKIYSKDPEKIKQGSQAENKQGEI